MLLRLRAEKFLDVSQLRRPLIIRQTLQKNFTVGFFQHAIVEQAEQSTIVQ